MGSTCETHEPLWLWRRGESWAGYDEVVEWVRQEREVLMKPLVEEVVGAAGEADVFCLACGAERAQNKGMRGKVIQHQEGAVASNREYYRPLCEQRVSSWTGV